MAGRKLYKRLVISYFDLAEARNYLFKLLGDDGNEAPARGDKLVRAALQTAFVVAYARPFSGNKPSDDVAREIPERFVRKLPPEQRALHDEVVQRRNEEFAHSDPTTADVIVFVSEHDVSPRYVTPVSSVTRAPMADDKLKELDALCASLYVFIYDEMERLRAGFTPGERF